ncbi:effector-associated domain EAD1-containing protein [Actinoplanes oblitus]|uniref:Effector-associated domain EAD1-containing protein n=1 Tax=Actinoplanes oblitus TaxID=3040509 RepID=A0ABY8WNG7_9ACTN|nr:effector-associated domain EAD1-containing protein [Actinoplanes oblitus]WIM99424.1 effector-associated domain EAD1-containing protein [Actinoplanes oblitus]
MPTRLSDRELEELSRLFPPGRPLTAKLLRHAGISGTLLPATAGITPFEYWSAVDDAIADGMIPDGRRSILGAALAVYPHNGVLGAGRWTVLFVGSSPDGTRRLRADRELRAIRELSGPFELRHRTAAAAGDLTAVRVERPDILHLSCHGDGGRLVFEGGDGKPETVSAADLAEALAAYREDLDLRLRGIVLNCCFGEVAAELLRGHADEVVAHRLELDDGCAVRFARELYAALPDAKSLAGAARVAVRELVLTDAGCRSLGQDLLVYDGSAG